MIAQATDKAIPPHAIEVNGADYSSHSGANLSWKTAAAPVVVVVCLLALVTYWGVNGAPWSQDSRRGSSIYDDPGGMTGSSAGSQPSLASRVAANLSPRTDYTSFDIPTPKVKVTGSAAGGGKIVRITYYVAGDEILNENAFVDGVSPATVDIMAGAFSEPDVKIVDVTWKTDFTDAYGKSSRDAAFDCRRSNNSPG